MVDKFLNSLREFVGFAHADDTHHAEQSRDHASSPLAAAFDPPRASTPSTANSSIDLASWPTGPQQQPTQRVELPGAKRSRQPSGRSDDERRLIPDYSTPADAVALPKPETWPTIRLSTGATMPKKPSANGSFKPINTLDGENLGHNRPRVTTYSKWDRSTNPLIGHEYHTGQKTYVENQLRKKLTTPHHHAPPREHHDQRLEGTTSVKRRKIQHESDEIVDDDDPVEISPPPIRRAPTSRSHETPRSTQSPRSHRSQGSVRPSTARKSGSPPPSGFIATGKVTDPHRPKRRNPGGSVSHGIQYPHQESQEKFPHGNHLEAQDDEIVEQVPSSRKQILDGIHQGVLDGVFQGGRPSSRDHHSEITSHHLPPKARINESTVEVEQLTSDSRDGYHRQSKDLRNYRPAQPLDDNDDPIDTSEDELAADMTTKPGKKKSPSKTVTASNNSARRKEGGKIPAGGWPLNFARTHGFEQRGPDIWLRRGTSSKGFRVVGRGTDGNLQTLNDALDFSHVTKLLTDDVSRIRLEGPRSRNGNLFVFDLEFVEYADFEYFYEIIAKPDCRSQISKDQSHLIKLHELPLQTNNKVGQSPLVLGDYVRSNQEQSNGQQSGLKPTLMDQLRQSSSLKSTSQPNDGKKTAQSSTRTLTRPPRSTRSGAPTHDLENTNDVRKVNKSVSKFSIEKGLGPRWHKSLSYGSGRQRSEVHQNDLTRLDDDEMLNDNLVDFYLSYMFDKHNVPAEKVYVWNTFFFPTLTVNTGRSSINYKAVERWTGRADMFSYDYIVVPINESFHWYLAIICNVSKIDRAPVIENFDEGLPHPTEKPAELGTEDETSTEHEVTDVPQPLDGPQLSTPAPKGSACLIDDDPNLFDEEKELRLVDRDDAGTESNLDHMDNREKTSQSPPRAEAAHVPHAATDSHTASAANVSTSNPPLTKKKGKSKPRQQRKDPDQPVIIILDSLSHTRTGTTRALKEWLRQEGKTKRGMEAEIKENGHYPKEPLIPTQQNLTDCGVYLLGYAEKFFRNPDEFKNRLLTGEMTTETDWPDMKPTEMRNKMRETLFELADQQKVRDKAARKAKKTAEKSKTAPTLDKPEPAKPMLAEPQPEDAVAKESEAPKVEVTGVESAKREEVESDVSPPAAAQNARLGSPFNYISQPAEPSPHLQSTENVYVPKVSDSPPIATSPIKPASTTPQAKPSPRKRSPEVRISTKHTPSHTTNGNSPAAGLHISATTSRLISPSRIRQHDGSNDRERLHIVKPPVKSPELTQQRVRGTSVNPIEIGDSQDLSQKDTVDHASAPVAKSSPAQRRPPSRSFIPLLRHSPSVVEVYPPTHTPKIERTKRNVAGNEYSRNDLEVQLEMAIQNRDGTSRDQAIALDRTQESDAGFDMMDGVQGSEAATQDVDVEMVPIDDVENTQDTVVAETPERNRSSPPAAMEIDTQVQTGWAPGDMVKKVMGLE